MELPASSASFKNSSFDCSAASVRMCLPILLVSLCGSEMNWSMPYWDFAWRRKSCWRAARTKSLSAWRKRT